MRSSGMRAWFGSLRAANAAAPSACSRVSQDRARAQSSSVAILQTIFSQWRILLRSAGWTKTMVSSSARTSLQSHSGIQIVDGKVVLGKIDQALGRTSANPLPAERLREKFDNCVARAPD